MRTLFNKLFRKSENIKIDISQEYWDMRMEYDNNYGFRRLFFPKSLFPNPVETQIIFIQGNRDEDIECNRFFKENLNEVKELFRVRGYDFFYLPEFENNITEFIRYNKPDVSPEEIANIASAAQNYDFDIINYAENKEVMKSQSSAFIRYVSSDCSDNSDSGTYYSFSYFEIKPFAKPDYISYKDVINWYLRGVIGGIVFYSLVKPKIEDTADYFFSDDTQKLISEVRDKLALLRQQGVSEMLLMELFEPTEKLSALYIDCDYRIFLPDYNNVEIKMEPLNKAVFFLFLRHNEGILFKHLIDYRDELAEIYEKITRCKCDEKQHKSIERICDSTSNSINEKCARIREAFLQHFDERLAKNYYVTGERGEVKSIKLSKKLVKWE
ncbi:MAG: hypothetical protein R3Y61_01070 [Rikenellaceae bacterium]